MKKLFLLFLISLTTAISVKAESVWLILNNYAGIEKIEMESMEQCELSGAKMISSDRAIANANFPFYFECIKGK